MQEKKSGNKQGELTLKRIVLHPDEPPVAAHRFFFTAVGDEIQLDIGFTDLPKLRDAIEGSKVGKNGEVELLVFQRLVLPLGAVIDLHETAQKMLNHLRQQGKITDEHDKPSN